MVAYMMSEPNHPRRDRYDTSGNPETEYVDAEHAVLRNKEGIIDSNTLLEREKELLAAAYERLLQEVRSDTPLTCDLLKHTHHAIFAPLYEWAGRYRTVWISKPGITWPAPDFLDEHMAIFERDVLAKYRPAGLHENVMFCRALAEIQGEFLVIHPFREGNARTIKLVTDLLAVQTGRLPLQYDQSEAGKEAYIAAAKAAFMQNYSPMTDVIRGALPGH
jgi:cell filamentation protein